MPLSAFAAVAAAALVAAAPLPHTAPVLSLTAAPPAVRVDQGSTQVRDFFVLNNAKTPVRVTARLTEVAKITGHCTPAEGQPVGVTLSAASFQLGPHQHGTETVTVDKTAPAQDLAVVFSSQPSGKGGARLSGAVGSQLAIGSAPICGAPPGVNWKTWGGIGLVLAAVLATLGLTWRRLRRRHQQGPVIA